MTDPDFKQCLRSDFRTHNLNNYTIQLFKLKIKENPEIMFEQPKDKDYDLLIFFLYT